MQYPSKLYKKQSNLNKFEKILKNFEKLLVFFKIMLYNDKVTYNDMVVDDPLAQKAKAHDF